MDFSYAGYMGGGVSLPIVPVKKTVKYSGAADATELIQSAINEVASLPVSEGFRGAILLEPGVYNCSGTISIAVDGIVLRGSRCGKEGSVIMMNGDKHSAIVIGKGRSRSSSAESATKTTISDKYVPSGSKSFTEADSKGFASGVENLHIQAPPAEVSHEQSLYNALRINGRDCWAKNMLIEETMNSVGRKETACDW